MNAIQPREGSKIKGGLRLDHREGLASWRRLRGRTDTRKLEGQPTHQGSALPRPGIADATKEEAGKGGHRGPRTLDL